MADARDQKARQSSNAYWAARGDRRLLPDQTIAVPWAIGGLRVAIVARVIGASAVAVTVAAMLLLIAGYAMVIDSRNVIASASIAGAFYKQDLYRLPGGVFFLVPKIEGSIHVTCRNGASTDLGYFGDHKHVSKVITGATCA